MLKFNENKEKTASEIRQAEARAEAIRLSEDRDALLRMMCQEKLEAMANKVNYPLLKNSLKHNGVMHSK